MTKQSVIADASLKPLLTILAIIVASTIFFLIYQVYIGNISCNVGYFPGVQGQIDLSAEEIETFPKMVAQTMKFVSQAKMAIRNSSKSMPVISKYLSGLKGPQSQYIISYFIGTPSHRAAPGVWGKEFKDASKGTLFAHGSADGFCDHTHPFCDDQREFKLGSNMWNFKNQSGFYPIRDWITTAKEGGGWIGSFWRNGRGVIQPKYTYIDIIPEKEILLASSFFITRTS